MLFAVSMTMIPMLGLSFIPATDTGSINISAVTDSGLTLQAGGRKAQEIQNKLKKYPVS